MRFDSIREHSTPFRHYSFENFFDEDELVEYKSMDFHESGGNILTKTRTSSNTRVFVDDVMCENHPLFKKLRNFFCSKSVINMFQSHSHKIIPEYLRMEVIKDVGEIWLEPHRDIQEKFMSMLVFVNDCCEIESIGTDLYDSNFSVIKTVPFTDNTGYFFYPSDDTWHGLERKKIENHRKMLMVNYVTFPTEIVVLEHTDANT